MSHGEDRRRNLIANLDFHVEAGLDLFLDEAPHDRFAETDAPEPARSTLDRPAPERRAPERTRPPLEDTFRTELPPRDVAAPAPARTYGQSASAKPGEQTARPARTVAQDAASLAEAEKLFPHMNRLSA